MQKVVKGEPIRPVQDKLIEASQAEEMQAVEAEVAATTEEQDLAVVS